MTRRSLVSSLAVAAALRSQASAAAPPERPQSKPREWKPYLGVLGPYTPGNVAWAKSEGFNNMILNGGVGHHATDERIAEVKRTLEQHQMHVSAFQITVNHIDPDLQERARINTAFVSAIEVAGKLGVPYIGTASGKDPAKPFQQQIDEIVALYTEKYFPACQQNHVRILWEPWPEGPNLATSPVGFAALFKGFGDSPYVGLQYDPSHLVRQFMDPIQTARDFVDKIYDVHLKDTQIHWPILRAGGINPVNGAEWWQYRIPGAGSMDWREFFNVLEAVGYRGAMSVEQEDALYGADNNPGPDFSDEFKVGFIMAQRYLAQYVPWNVTPNAA